MTDQSYEKSYLGKLRKLIGKEKVIINAARAVIFDNVGHLLLIRRRDNRRWAMPAGAMELEESIYDCVIREVLEETGLTVQKAELYSIWSDPVKTSIVTEYGDPYHLVVFVFHIADWSGKLIKLTNETIDAQFFPLDELPDIAQYYHKTILDLETYKLDGRLILN